MPFKMDKIIFFSRNKDVCLSYLKFSDPLSKTHLFSLFGLIDNSREFCKGTFKARNSNYITSLLFSVVIDDSSFSFDILNRGAYLSAHV